MGQMDKQAMFSMVSDDSEVRVVVLGIGGMGNNAVENLALAGTDGVELYAVNTDQQALDKCSGSVTCQIGVERTRGKGAGGDNEIGRLSAEDDIDSLRKIVTGAELVFIAAGMGGGTGTGAAPVVARLCRKLGILTVGVVTTPMEFEGVRRSEKARAGIEELGRYVDSLVTVENEKLSLIMDEEDISIIQAFKIADDVLLDCVKGITRLIKFHGYINLDLADLKNVLRADDSGRCWTAMIGIGEARGEHRAVEAVEAALGNQLLANTDINGASRLLVNVAGSDSMRQHEASQVMELISSRAANHELEIFMGVVADPSLDERMSVTVIATGIWGRGDSTKAVTPGHREGRLSSPPRLADEPSGGSVERTLVDCVTEGSSYERHGGDAEPAGFGISPLITRSGWQIPAYMRRQGKCRDLAMPAMVGRLAPAGKSPAARRLSMPVGVDGFQRAVSPAH